MDAHEPRPIDRTCVRLLHTVRAVTSQRLVRSLAHDNRERSGLRTSDHAGSPRLVTLFEGSFEPQPRKGWGGYSMIHGIKYSSERPSMLRIYLTCITSLAGKEECMLRGVGAAATFRPHLALPGCHALDVLPPA